MSEVYVTGRKLVLSLQIVHDKSLVHGYIKPSNILLRTRPPSTLTQQHGSGHLDLDFVLVDFGHAAPYVLDDGDYLDQNRSPYGAAGSSEFMDFNIYMGIGNIPRDDMISLAYSLTPIIHGELSRSNQCTYLDMIILSSNRSSIRRSWVPLSPKAASGLPSMLPRSI
ncbi:hypothetical protein CONPUDRAFT_165818 [Coniophora puteana RWD-64-598 SS2]|uniref:Protein kinase domain-containing protein n=1 Tax=Coniophora puteana (strain RWD-64-598) TaxID=741705 RepID=A0A5M3MN87_CONPW|nr:uncharacterized protein CONPUDRAFT_165818 [Coniophora puteana RWD-64-598 SS2]EIW80234.1 hypothetical protein CONPUDRAFT_165818 [Coniophora puteana RWD-64-598 SS2]